MNANRQDSGIALVTVVCFAAILAILAAGILTESMLQTKVARRQTGVERAFYVAEGGAERAVSYICSGGHAPGTITGSIGNGRYTTTIIATETLSGPGGGGYDVSGTININPNSSPDNEFLLVMADGTIIMRDDLSDMPDKTGTAILIYVKPKGSGSQNELSVDGAPYPIDNSTAYTFSSAGMQFSLDNDNRNPNGKPIGQWSISLDGTSVGISDESSASGTEIQYSIFSLGISDGVRRIVILEGVYQKSWAKYALWYNNDAYGCWFKAGEKFYGPIHANCNVNFSGDPEFFKLLSTSMPTNGGSTNSVIFHEGFELGAPVKSMASVNFTALRSDATLVLTGETSIALSDTNLVVSNSRKGWTNETMALSTNCLLYVSTAKSGTKSNGDIKVAGTLDGRLTLVAERNIMITNNIEYAVSPTNDSNDALGLIAGRDVRIETSCPDNLNVYAHIMATGNDTTSTSDGKFYVVNYDSPPPRGTMTVYGGIVQYTRGPVGTFSQYTGQMSSGFEKNYIFDTRFATTPPPHYPVITNEYTWTSWREMAP